MRVKVSIKPNPFFSTNQDVEVTDAATGEPIRATGLFLSVKPGEVSTLTLTLIDFELEYEGVALRHDDRLDQHGPLQP
jgi:hypothetical protein